MVPVLVFPHLGARLGVELTEFAEVNLVLVNHLFVCHEITYLRGLMIALVTFIPHTQVDGFHVSLEVRFLPELLPTVTARKSLSVVQRLHVNLQVTSLSEFFLTKIARKFFLPFLGSLGI